MNIFNKIQSLKTKLIANKEFWLILIISIIAFGLRLYRLGATDLWYDEIWSVQIAKNFLFNWNPPIYFIILHYWIKLVGISEFALRFPSLLFSVVSVPCLFLLGKQIFNFRVGLSACLIMCLSSFHLWYAQEARPYSLSVLVSILSTYFLYRFLTEGKIKFGFIYVLFSIVALYSNITYYHIFLLFAQLLAACMFIKKNVYLKLLAFFGLIFLAFSFRLGYFITKFLIVKGGFWIPVPDLKSLIITLENFNLGYTATAWTYWFSDLITLLILAWGFLSLVQNEARKKSFIYVLIVGFLPIGLIFIFSKIFFSVYLDRAMIIFSPYYYLLLGLWVDYLKSKRLKKIIVFAFLIISFMSLYNYYQNIMPLGGGHHLGVVLKKPYKPVLKFIENNFKPGDAIMHTNYFSLVAFSFYSRNKDVPQNLLFALKMVDTNWNRPYKSGPGIISVEELSSFEAKRLWVISSNCERGEELDNNSLAVNSQMNRLYKLDLNLEFDGLKIYRYLKI